MSGMYGEIALELIKELDRHKGKLPAFQENELRQALDEMQILFEQNQRDVSMNIPGNPEFLAALHLRHAALERNKQCILAYLYTRLKVITDMRWEHGPVIPANVRANMTEQEVQFFANYNKTLANYMGSLGENHGLDLTQDLKPPKTLMVEIRVLQDYGEFELEDGSSVLLKKDSVHFLPMSQCEALVQQQIVRIVEKQTSQHKK
ncbi:DNA replication complex GINS protein PSF1 [Orchesella cincta]|uniref:DNA replication complex GINS protein PSF1 n=1 Tax=Orchesella cincta TaxID=48709 RepID=A0A1D2N876_ORCCI|nr:DNA replication complex GINS protein PSF1 [Orchesella cincta]